VESIKRDLIQNSSVSKVPAYELDTRGSIPVKTNTPAVLSTSYSIDGGAW
jgi:hypothetical protein